MKYFLIFKKKLILLVSILHIVFFLKGQTNLLSILNHNENSYETNKIEDRIVLDLVVENQRMIPQESFKLYQNQPNPFSKETTIQFELLHSSSITLTVYDPEGKVLKEYKGNFEKGKNKIQINSKDLHKYGILYYQMTTKNQILSKKMIFKKPSKT